MARPWTPHALKLSSSIPNAYLPRVLKLPGSLPRSALLALSLAAAGACATPDQSGGDTAGSPPRSASYPGIAGDSLAERTAAARLKGRPTAPLMIVEVSDFQCPYCRMWYEQTYPALEREYIATGKVQLLYVNLPLPSHRHAWPAAEAAMCAGRQGQFWPMHDALFETQEAWSGLQSALPFFDTLASRTGVGMTAWRACMASGASRPLIQRDAERSTQAGVNSTPTFVIGERALEGAFPIDSFRPLIDAELARLAEAGASVPR